MSVCRSVLQRVAVCCRLLFLMMQCLFFKRHCNACQCVAVCCSVLQCVAVCCFWWCSVVFKKDIAMRVSGWYLSMIITHLHTRVAVCCSVLQCVAACCSVLQCVAVCCSVLQCVAVILVCHHYHPHKSTTIGVWYTPHKACNTHCNTMQHTATHCNTLSADNTCLVRWVMMIDATHCNTHCNTMQHTATHCLQIILVLWGV